VANEYPHHEIDTRALAVKVREASGISQNALAKALNSSKRAGEVGLSQSGLSKWELGSLKLTLPQLDAISRRIGLRAEFLRSPTANPWKGIPFLFRDGTVRRLTLPENESGWVDTELLHLPVVGGQVTDIILLRPFGFSNIKSHNRKTQPKHSARAIYALLAKVSGHLILFTHRDKDRMLGDVFEWLRRLENWPGTSGGIRIGLYRMSSDLTKAVYGIKDEAPQGETPKRTAGKTKLTPRLFAGFLDREQLWHGFLSKVGTLSFFDDHAQKILFDQGFASGYNEEFWSLPMSAFKTRLDDMWVLLHRHEEVAQVTPSSHEAMPGRMGCASLQLSRFVPPMSKYASDWAAGNPILVLRAAIYESE
jgi:transcriptional regulator with XRE-family HTH domain